MGANTILQFSKDLDSQDSNQDVQTKYTNVVLKGL